MANTVATTIKYKREVQKSLSNQLVALKVCGVEMSEGNAAINKAYLSEFAGETYTPGTDMTERALIVTADSISLNKARGTKVYIDDLEKAKTQYDFSPELVSSVTTDMAEYLDGDALSYYASAVDTIDDGDLGGTAGTGVSIASSNVLTVLSKAKTKISNNRGQQNNLKAILSPSVVEAFEIAGALRDTPTGDQFFTNGYMGRFLNAEVYMSNNLTWTGVWTPANNPSDTQTLTINGVTVTFVASLTGGDGEVLIGVATANTLDNLVSLLNDPLNTAGSSNYSAFSYADYVNVNNAVATDGTTYLGLELIGAGEISVATSDTADPWTLTNVHSIIMNGGAITGGMLKYPMVEMNRNEDRFGDNYKFMTAFGFGVWTNNAKSLIDVPVEIS